MAARFDYATCEPFRAWNRLEPRPRQVNFDRALRSEVHDPLWMLTRQWQFGEFQGEDTGSPIFAKIQVQSSRITKFQARGETPQTYNDHVPLEALVERQPARFDYRARLQAGRQWLRLLDHYGNAFNGGANTPAYDGNAYRAVLLNLHPIQVPSVDEANDSPGLQVQKARIITNQRLHRFLQAVSGRSFDGIDLFRAMNADLTGSLNNFVRHINHRPFLEQAAGDFMAWCSKRFGLGTGNHSAWENAQLEYQFSCAHPNPIGDNTVLRADEYYHGKLDWYAFEVDRDVPSGSAMLGSSQAERDQNISTETLTIIPTEAAYAGMPNSRWWEFEDGKVDLGNINADTTDLAKVLLSEFALVYGNDWYSLPCSVPAGSLSAITGIVVTDVFGEKTLVQAATQGETGDWASWGMFNLSTRLNDNSQPVAADTRLFMPPAVARVQEREPEEEVRFIRDEMANVVWAIETRIADLLGDAQDAHASAAELGTFLEALEAIEAAEPSDTGSPEERAKLLYKLSNSIPENWIPFVPAHIGNQNRAIQLQRAAMPRRFRDQFQAVRPRSDILRAGMRNDPGTEVLPFINPSNDIQDTPYYINEEEIPKTGIKVTASNQRTRWYNGRIFQWCGRRKAVGRGEGSSGLYFDRVIPQ